MPTLRIALVPLSLIAMSVIWVSIANAAETGLPSQDSAFIEPTRSAPTSTFATTVDSSATSTSRSERREAIANAISENRIQLSVRAQERITNLAANISNRFEAAVNRLQNISDRVASRSTKLAATGIDTGSATPFIQAANADIARVRTALLEIDTAVSDTVRGADVRTSWQTTRTRFTTMRGDIISAQVNLRQALVALKRASDRPALVSTTSAETIVE